MLMVVVVVLVQVKVLCSTSNSRYSQAPLHCTPQSGKKGENLPADPQRKRSFIVSAVPGLEGRAP